MDEEVRVKDKDAAAAKPDEKDENLKEGLEETFPASDPVSATRGPEEDKDEKQKA